MDTIKQKIIQYKTGLIAVLVMLAVIAGAFSLLGGDSGLPEPSPKPVSVITVREIDAAMEVEYIGLVESALQKQAGFKTAGRLELLLVSEGDTVSAGQALAALDQRDLQRAYLASENTKKAASEAFRFLENSFEKFKALQEAGGLSAQELERHRLELENQRAAYENARIDLENKASLLEDAVLRADFEGTVSRTLFRAGEMVPAGQPVVIINSTGTMITTGISQKDMALINSETPVTVAYAGLKLPAEIISINHIPDPATRTYRAELEVDRESAEHTMPAGSLVRVFFETSREKAISIPLSIISNDGRDYVFVIDHDQQVTKKNITLGQVRNQDVIVFGLEDGDLVVSEGFRNINHGDQVIIKEQEDVDER